MKHLNFLFLLITSVTLGMEHNNLGAVAKKLKEIDYNLHKIITNISDNSCESVLFNKKKLIDLSPNENASKMIATFNPNNNSLITALIASNPEGIKMVALAHYEENQRAQEKKAIEEICQTIKAKQSPTVITVVFPSTDNKERKKALFELIKTQFNAASCTLLEIEKECDKSTLKTTDSFAIILTPQNTTIYVYDNETFKDYAYQIEETYHMNKARNPEI